MQTYSELVDGVTTMGELYTRINSNFQVIISNFSGTSFPNPQGPGHPCFRTDRGAAGVMYVYTSDISQGENGWLDIVAASPALMALDEEVEAARGTASSLAARLAVIMNPDGTLLGDAPVGDWWENVPDFTYVGESSFACAGDVAHLFEDGMGLQITLADDTYTYTRVSGAATYSDFAKLTTVAVADAVLTADMTKVERGQKTSNAPLVSYDRAEVDAKIDAVCKPRFTVTSQDWDTLVNPGVYKVAGATGDNAASTESTSGLLVVSAYSQTGYVWQEYVGAATVRRWSRWWNGTTWFPWVEQVMDPSTVARKDQSNFFSAIQYIQENELKIRNAESADAARLGGDTYGGYLISNNGNFNVSGGGGGGTQVGLRAHAGGYGVLLHRGVERLAATLDGVGLIKKHQRISLNNGQVYFNNGGVIDDGVASGLVFQAYCSGGGNFSFGDLVCGYSTTGANLYIALPSVQARMPCIGIMVESALGGSVGMYSTGPCYIRNDDWSFTANAQVYVSSSGGQPTSVAPSASGEFVQVVGTALATNILLFNPSQTIIRLA